MPDDVYSLQPDSLEITHYVQLSLAAQFWMESKLIYWCHNFTLGTYIVRNLLDSCLSHVSICQASRGRLDVSAHD